MQSQKKKKPSSQASEKRCPQQGLKIIHRVGHRCGGGGSFQRQGSSGKAEIGMRFQVVSTNYIADQDCDLNLFCCWNLRVSIMLFMF